MAHTHHISHSSFTLLTPPSAISGLPHLLRQGELLRLREPQKWILWPIWGLGGYT